MRILDTEVFVEITGQGQPVVVLHGWGASTKTMRSISAFLEKKYQVIAVDFPGFGQSPPPPAAWTVNDYARMVEALLQALSVETPVLMGHSFGGSVIIELCAALRYPAKKLVLMGSAGVKPMPTEAGRKKGKKLKMAKAMAKWLPFGMGELLVERMKNKMGSEDYRNAQGVMREILVKKVNYDQREQLPLVEPEALLIWGENDTATPLSDGQLMEQAMPHAGLAVIQNAGHFSFLENPRQFFAVLDSYL